MVETDGGWLLHNKINPKDDFEMKINCMVCKLEYIISLNNNVRYVIKNIYEGMKTEYKKGLLLTNEINYEFYQPTNCLLAVCPNCSYTFEVGCIPAGPQKKESVYIMDY